MSLVSRETIVLFGAGSANIGAANLLHKAGGVPKSQIFIMGSRGLIWKTADGKGGCYRNNEQKEFAVVGEPTFAHRTLMDVVTHIRPSVLVGAAGRAPGAFDKALIEKMVEVNQDEACHGEGAHDDSPAHRPVIFALSNPSSQAECT